MGTSLLGMALVGAALLLGGCTDETAQSQSLTAQSHNAVGAWDMTFFGVGFQFYNGSGVGVDVGNAILVQPDGKILVGGATDDGSTGTDPAIWRIMPFGNFDTAFGLGGLAVQPNGISAADQINGLTIDKTGMIVGAGQQFNTGTSSYDMAMWRFFPDGLFESQFTHSGPTGNTDDVANAVIEDAVGHYMVVGTTDNGASGNDLMIWAVRDTSMSSLDASNFNPGFGYKVFDAGGSNFDTATAVLLQPDGQLLVAGSGVVSSTTYAMSVRVDSLSGATDTLYGASGKSLVTGLGATTTIRGMVRQPS
ncbi:MAG TPA: delta-60 repeat domain-containing protein, partial [bacterium]